MDLLAKLLRSQYKTKSTNAQLRPYLNVHELGSAAGVRAHCDPRYDALCYGQRVPSYGIPRYCDLLLQLWNS